MTTLDTRLMTIARCKGGVYITPAARRMRLESARLSRKIEALGVEVAPDTQFNRTAARLVRAALDLARMGQEQKAREMITGLL